MRVYGVDCSNLWPSEPEDVSLGIFLDVRERAFPRR